ncbi:prolipoprotein diacylglyceryl transferase [Paremcibacter congregatus]|uniref:Phosphatidylglycerol--prolipoprotein diacylglyceryl transferase n=1 Tax=Paremcibacter congregatus TaxID=2043170 RepID=A0A2G4YV94_9PROT|nr:prolipoprotein diacylglyceryl transferase [Paremcibacter congregatus]PHZ86251.1 prolipoprotein diacylglyceryl transferase [Paremcibacter congregatus]QDE27217.1 prolipoprotein diacylglyceryl transferase [Paremcibacter congregatus]
MFEFLLSASLTFPDISPEIVRIGPIAIRWYSMAYLLGWGIGWFYLLQLIKKKGAPCNAAQVGDFAFWAMVGVILGGRLGYVLFYNLDVYLHKPAEIFAVWDGGMSFHGGFIGVAIATYIFCRTQKIAFWRFTDLLACVAPVGLFLGRIANFINGELFGRPTDAAIGMVFPRGGPLPRHPSQLYEAALEGLLLFFLLWVLMNFTNARKKPGLLTGVFVIGYAISRTIVEQFREPDNQLGFLYGTDFLTMGQLLSIPMVLVGLYLIFRPKKAAL